MLTYLLTYYYRKIWELSLLLLAKLGEVSYYIILVFIIIHMWSSSSAERVNALAPPVSGAQTISAVLYIYLQVYLYAILRNQSCNSNIFRLITWYMKKFDKVWGLIFFTSKLKWTISFKVLSNYLNLRLS